VRGIRLRIADFGFRIDLTDRKVARYGVWDARCGVIRLIELIGLIELSGRGIQGDRHSAERRGSQVYGFSLSLSPPLSFPYQIGPPSYNL
jgi:hypothetical protein